MKKRDFLLLLVIFLIFIPNKIQAAGVPEYRALLIGNSIYWDGNSLSGPGNDILKMEEALKNSYFGEDNKSFSKIVKRRNIIKNGIINNIRVAYRGAKAEDVSYFYYSGHGDFDEKTKKSALVGVDGVNLGVDELERELRKIPGKIVIILDSCNSGGFIKKGKNTKPQKDGLDSSDSLEKLEEYNASIIDAFSNKRSKAYLTSDKYKVITASAMDEWAYELDYVDGWGIGGEFTRAFVTGNGYKGKFLADTNKDDKVSLDEIYKYTKARVNESSVQVYPVNDKYIIGSKFKKKAKETILWEEFYDVPIKKSWEIGFNLELDDKSWRDRVYILDSNKKKIPATLKKSLAGKGVLVSPEGKYKYGEEYTIIVEDNILAKNGLRHRNEVLVRFFTEKQAMDFKEVSLGLVKNGILHSHSYPFLGQALDKFFNLSSWEYFYSTDGHHLVEFTGGVLRDGEPGLVKLQFIVDLEDESFKLDYASFEDVPMSYDEFGKLVDLTYENYPIKRENDIKEVFSKKEEAGEEDLVLDKERKARLLKLNY